MIDQNAGRPDRTYQWNLSLQREVTRDLVVEAAYVGNRNIWQSTGGFQDFNAVSESILGKYGFSTSVASDATLLQSTLTNANAMAAAVGDLETIVGQKVVITKAKRSISQFKLRQGQSIGCMVTLRGARMFDFLDKLFNVALPRVRDFSGVSPDSFDGRGNYTLGLREQLIFPEIQYDEIDRLRGMEIAIVTTALSDHEGRRLLELMGMPFRTQPAERGAR
ncbi:MAG: 50S ribosomal protein L5 [Proteobacteria bacterium]|nr:50S ribosomal protein L5 [Pseudomonadota bacterium]